MDLSTSNISVS